MRHVYQCSVRFDDLDAFGHVNNVTFAEYLQEARIDFAHRHLTRDETSHEGSVVVHQSIDYLAPVPFRVEPLQVELWVTKIGRSSMEFAAEVTDTASASHTASTLDTASASHTATDTDTDSAADDDGTAETAAATVYARATTVLVAYDLRSSQPRPVTPAERAALQPYLEEAS